MTRRTPVGAAILLVMAACLFPTDVCGCTPVAPAAKVYGRVLGATGAPIVGASVTASTSRAPCVATTPPSPLVAQATTVADGKYRIVAPVEFKGSACVLVRATSGGGSASAAAVVESGIEGDETLDSVRVDIQIP